MDSRFIPLARDAERSVSVWIYPKGTTFLAVRDGSAIGTDLAPYASRIEQRPAEATVQLAWNQELYGAAQPVPDQLIKISLGDQALWVGVIEGLSEYRNASGERRMSIVARSRDALPAWRQRKRVTQIYPLGTRVGVIANDIAESAGLQEQEISLPQIEQVIPHDNFQIGDQTAWEMLETVLLPVGMSPFIDGLGRLKARSRDIITRSADISLTEDRIVAVTGAKASPPPGSVRLRWLDPMLTEVSQADRVLAGANITAGFFQPRQRQKVYWSDDRTQRARNTRLVIRQSANSGLVKVCSEGYAVRDEYHGSIELETSAWVSGLIGVFLTMKAAALIPDGVASFGGGVTIPYGRVIKAGIEFGALLVMVSIGTGSYEIWGEPYHFVNARNLTEAYDSGASAWAESSIDLDSDLIVNLDHAKVVSARELVYVVRASSSYGVQIIDDPRIEPGDILALPDGSRIYVTDYRRSLGRDAPAVLDVEGFPA